MFYEIIKDDALDKANLNDVRFLINHDTDMIPLARSNIYNENSTMKIEIDKKGMLIQVYLDTKNNLNARALYSAIKRKDITGMSFMFSIDDESWENLDTEHPTRYIKKIGQVLEVSAVTFPAYESTEISARNKIDLQKAKKTSKDIEEKIKNQKILNLEKSKILALY